VCVKGETGCCVPARLTPQQIAGGSTLPMFDGGLGAVVTGVLTVTAIVLLSVVVGLEGVPACSIVAGGESWARSTARA
jgi:hypothetical protein